MDGTREGFVREYLLKMGKWRESVGSVSSQLGPRDDARPDEDDIWEDESENELEKEPEKEPEKELE